MLRFDIVRDTLIIVPKGDVVGYSEPVFNRELAALRRTIKQRESLRNLVIDLSESNYFSPDTIEQLKRLQTGMQPGGQVVICSPSEDVQVALQGLGLPELPGIYRSAASALSGVTGSPMSGTYYFVRSRARMLSRVGIAAIAVTAIALSTWLMMVMLRAPQDERDYARMREIARELKVLRQSQPSTPELRDFAAEAQNEVLEIIKRYRESADSQIEKQLLIAATALNRDLLRDGAVSNGTTLGDAFAEVERRFAADGRPLSAARE